MSVLPPTASATTVPALNGLSDADARTALTAAGLTRGSITADGSCQAPAGILTSQSPAAGQHATPGDPVNRGEPTGKTAQGGPCHPVVPSLFGDDGATALQAIAAQGLTVGTGTTGSSCLVRKGDVYHQNPAASTPDQPGQAVNIIESSGLGAHSKPLQHPVTRRAP